MSGLGGCRSRLGGGGVGHCTLQSSGIFILRMSSRVIISRTCHPHSVSHRRAISFQTSGIYRPQTILSLPESPVPYNTETPPQVTASKQDLHDQQEAFISSIHPSREQARQEPPLVSILSQTIRMEYPARDVSIVSPG